jgi:hypothetical protein
MTFSEREKEILRELEESFNSNRSLTEITRGVVDLGSTHSSNRGIWYINAIISLVFIIITFTINPWLAFLGCAGLFFSVYKIYNGINGRWSAARQSIIEERMGNSSSI